LDDNILLFTCVYDKAIGKVKLICRTINYNLEVEKFEEIDSKKVPIMAWQGLIYSSFSLKLFDAQKMILLTKYDAENKGPSKNTVIAFQEYNYKLEKQRSKILKLKVDLSSFYVSDIDLYKDEFYMICKVWSTDGYVLNVISFGFDDDEIKSYDLGVDKYFSSILMTFDNDETVYFTGLFLDKNKRGNVANIYELNGMYIVTLNIKSHEIDKRVLVSFSPQLLAQFRKSSVSKDGEALMRFTLDRVRILKDGSVVFLIEKALSETMDMGEIAAMRIGLDGEIKWCTNIYKIQKMNMAYMSYAFNYDTIAEKMRILYADNPLNSQISDKDKIKVANDITKSDLMFATIDVDGKLDKEKIYSIRKDEKYPMVKISDFQDNNTILFYNIQYLIGRYKLTAN
jgi:hypothetical protein